ncbi:MAG: hypothetical protein KAS32_04515 [Candidatus Peribacteraceae bacterium]|nr:hypothetical protein [Candidatus Peribacteraceae bacterium]
MLKQSLAGTNKDYVVLQVAPYSGTDLHIQGSGHESNRNYGVAVTFPCSADLHAFITKNGKAFTKSLAGTGRKYCELQATFREGGSVIHFQLPANTGCNRSYGIAFQVKSDELPELAKFIDAELSDPTDEYKDAYGNPMHAANIVCK